MSVMRKNLAYPALMTDTHRNAIGQTVTFIKPVLIKFKSTCKGIAGLRQNQYGWVITNLNAHLAGNLAFVLSGFGEVIKKLS